VADGGSDAPQRPHPAAGRAPVRSACTPPPPSSTGTSPAAHPRTCTCAAGALTAGTPAGDVVAALAPLPQLSWRPMSLGHCVLPGSPSVHPLVPMYLSSSQRQS